MVAAVSERLPIAVLVSGEGTNLQALLDTVHGREAEVVAVASSVPGVAALERAASSGVPAQVFARDEYPGRAARDDALADWLAGRGARLVVLAGYMELLGEPFLARFPGAVINVHPSLLPAFPGLAAIEQALAYGVKVSGCTVHFADNQYDHGPIILQRTVEVRDDDTPESLGARVHEQENEAFPEAIRLFTEGRLKLEGRRVRIRGDGDRPPSS